jgi:hypothetical protein
MLYCTEGWMLFSLFYQVSAVTFVGGSLAQWRQERLQLLGAVKAGDLAGRQKAVDLKTKKLFPHFRICKLLNVVFFKPYTSKELIT